MTTQKLMANLETRAALRKIGGEGDDAFEIGRAALLLAALDHPLSDITSYLDHLAELANDVNSLVRRDTDHHASNRTDALANIIATERGYRGDTHTYDDSQNANLMSVIDRRKGLPVGLAIIYLDVAHRLQWEATGINFPGQFLIRLEHGTDRRIVDPFNSGIEHNVADLRALLKQVAGLEAELRPEHYSPVSRRDTLIRLLNNIKLRAVSANNYQRGAEIVERMLLIAPQRLSLLQEASIFYSRIGNLHRAAMLLENFLTQSTNDAERHEVATLLHRVRSRLN